MGKKPANAVKGKQGFQKTGRSERGKDAPQAVAAPAGAGGGRCSKCGARLNKPQVDGICTPCKFKGTDNPDNPRGSNEWNNKPSEPEPENASTYRTQYETYKNFRDDNERTFTAPFDSETGYERTPTPRPARNTNRTAKSAEPS